MLWYCHPWAITVTAMVSWPCLDTMGCVCSAFTLSGDLDADTWRVKGYGIIQCICLPPTCPGDHSEQRAAAVTGQWQGGVDWRRLRMSGTQSLRIVPGGRAIFELKLPSPGLLQYSRWPLCKTQIRRSNSEIQDDTYRAWNSKSRALLNTGLCVTALVMLHGAGPDS